MVYLLLGFFVIPALVKRQLLHQLPPATHRTATVREVRFNPFVLALTVKDLSLLETNGQPFASFQEFYANFQLSSLFRWTWTFDEIRLTSPRAELVLNTNKSFNFANLFETRAGASSASVTTSRSAIPRLLVFDLSITNGHVGFADLSRRTPFRTEYHPINLHLNRFTTHPESASPYAFEASSDKGRQIRWSGSVTAQPIASAGRLQIEGIRLAPHAPYIEDFTRAKLTDGTLDIAGRYALAVKTNGVDLTVSELAVTVEKLELRDPTTDEAVLGVPSFALQGGQFDLQKRRASGGTVVIRNPTALVRRSPDGLINLVSLIQAEPRAASLPSQASAKPGAHPTGLDWLFSLDNVLVQEASVRLEDSAAPGSFQSVLKPVNVELRNFSTAANAQATVKLDLMTDANETLSVTADYVHTPPHGSASIKLGRLDLKRYGPYLAPFFKGTINSGNLGVAVDLSQEGRGPAQQIVATNASLLLSDLEIRSVQGTEALVRIPYLALDKGLGNLADKVVEVGGLVSTGATFKVQREPTGAIDLLSLIATNSPRTAAVTNSAAWNFALGELSLRNWAVHITDQMAAKPAPLQLDQVALTLRGARWPSNASVATELAARVNESGAFAFQGTVQPVSQALDGTVLLSGLELRGFQPWITPYLRLGVESGTLSTTGQIAFAMAAEGAPHAAFTGALDIAKLSTVDQVQFKELARWDQLSLEGIHVEIEPNQANVRQVTLSGLQTSVILDAARHLNLLSLFPSASTNEQANLTPAASGAVTHPGFAMEVGELKLEKAAIQFEDHSVDPHCVFAVQQLDGKVTSLSSKPDSRADAEFTGHVDDTSPFMLRGRVNPLAGDLALDLVFTNHNLQLTPFSPYMEKYAGHPLHKGRVSLDLNYVVEAKRLQAKNKVQIDQLLLGPRNSNSDATKLPVKLAVALLKDNNGRIDLDAPLDGRLDDPQFRIGPVILKIVVNLIAKTVASPFKLIGALVGGGEELSFVDFAPGTVDLLPGETNKLDKLIQALEKRPALSLEIEGSIDPHADRDAVARNLVENQVRSQRLQELATVGRAPVAMESFAVEPLEQERLLRVLLTKTCGTNLSAAVQAFAARAAAATNGPATVRQPVRGPGLIGRVTSLFKPKKERAATRQAHLAAKADARLLEANPELASLSPEDMEALIAAQTEVPVETLRQLMQDRAKAVQSYLLSTGKVTDERLFLLAPKTTDASAGGEARAHLSLD